MINLLAYKAWMIEPMYLSRMVLILRRVIANGTLEQFFEQSYIWLVIFVGQDANCISPPEKTEICKGPEQGDSKDNLSFMLPDRSHRRL